MTTVPIDADRMYYVRTICPSCDLIDIVLVRLDAVLTQTRAEAFLSVKASPKKIEHQCDQHTIRLGDEYDDESEVVDGVLALPYVDEETGEILDGDEVEQ